MIYVDIKGNLGNQMFIYATARRIQKITGQKIQLNTYYLNKYYKNYSFNLDIFKLNENIEIVSTKRIPFFASSSSKFYKLYTKLTFNRRIFKLIYYKFFSLFNIIVNDSVDDFKIKIKNEKDVYLSGFFQNPKYFSDIKDILIEEFTLKDQPSLDLDFLSKVQSSNSVCVSIRRGDYASVEKINKIHFVCDNNYFNYAINMMQKNIDNPIFIFFSDDPQWVRDNYKIPGSLYEKDGLSLAEKIEMMKNCKHFILSNSSFSWWMEYLSNKADKKVIAPSKWYRDGRKTAIYQNYWLLINV